MNPRWVILAVCVGLVGCFGPRTRFQSAEENDTREAELRTIGDVAELGSQSDIQVMGVGLVVQLSGTGGGAPPQSPFRDMLEHDLKKRGIQNVKQVLESTDCAMVLVQARIPAGSHKNDMLDVDVSLPPMSRCTSLRGGYLLACELFTYESSRSLSSSYQGPDQTLKGSPIMKAEGPVISGLTGRVRIPIDGEKDDKKTIGNEEDSVKTGKVWGGGRCQVEPPIMLVLNPDQQLSRVAAQVADRVNQTFPGMKYGRDGIASAKNKAVIMLGVPTQYRHDLPHYLRVVGAIPLDRNPPIDGAYRRLQAENLLDPAKCLGAATRLEALGEDSVPALRKTLAAPLPLSRFAAAQALTYLRKRDGVDELTRLARQYPVLRGLCLTTMASLDESICHTRLTELLADPEPELRYGAFCGLRRLDERSTELGGEKCKDAFMIHQVAPESTPMVHYVTSRRTEIVLFGRSPQLLPEVRLSAGEDFTVSTSPDGQTCTLKRFSLRQKRIVEKQCSTNVADVLRTLAEMGGDYSDAVDLLTKVHAHHKLNCDVYHDALPRLVEASVLARASKDDPSLRSALALRRE